MQPEPNPAQGSGRQAPRIRAPGLRHWLYVSQSSLHPAWAPAAVDAIVASSVPRNTALGLTGALLFTGVHFVQSLEGEAESLHEVRKSIQADGRHRSIVTLADERLAERRFEDWSLAYTGASHFLARRVEQALETATGHRKRSAEQLLAMLTAFAVPAARPA